MRSFTLLLAAAAVSCISAWNPPLYKQCDPSWGQNQMGVKGNGERSNICGEGCAMSSVSMALAGIGVKIGRK